jgi:DNA modification methylase
MARHSSCDQTPPPALFDLHRGDARRLEELLGRFSTPADPLVTCTITSPPYGDLKNYGDPDQIGWGQPYDEYLTDLRRVFRAVHKHTRDDGSLWIIADTLRPGGDGLRRLEALPFQIADELTEVGWTLRDIVIWKKDKTLPWSGRGRLRNAFEYVMLFIKTPAFKYHVDRLREPDQLEEWWVKWPERYNPDGKVPDNVWEIKIPVQGTWGSTTIQHSCPLPPDLVERLIYLSTDVDDVVFDPFGGSGVVLAEAERLGRRPIGIELSATSVKAYKTFVRPELLHRRGDDPLLEQERRRNWLRERILTLRMLKFPSALMKQLEKQQPNLPVPALAVVLADPLATVPKEAFKLVSGRLTFGLDAEPSEREAVRDALISLADQQPASKFGVAAEIEVVTVAELQSIVAQRDDLFVYPGTRTYEAEGRVVEALPDLVARLRADRRTRPPVLGNLYIRERPRKLDLSQPGAMDLEAEPGGTTPTNGTPAANGRASVNGKPTTSRKAKTNGTVSKKASKAADDHAGLGEPQTTNAAS